jgi:hypothetical protein
VVESGRCRGRGAWTKSPIALTPSKPAGTRLAQRRHKPRYSRRRSDRGGDEGRHTPSACSNQGRVQTPSEAADGTLARVASGHPSIVPQHCNDSGILAQKARSASSIATHWRIRSAANSAWLPHFFSGRARPDFLLHGQGRRRLHTRAAACCIAKTRSPLRTRRRL